MLPLLIKVALTMIAAGVLSLVIAVAVDLITDLKWNHIASKFVYGGFGVTLLGVALFVGRGLFELWNN